MDVRGFDCSAAVWRKSSYSNNGGACVEVADNLPGVVAVRDSKDRSGPLLLFAEGQWEQFIDAIQAGELDIG